MILNNSVNSSAAECEPLVESFLDIKIWLVGIFGPLLALFGAFSSILTGILLVRSRLYRQNSYFLYLTLMAAFDLCFCSTYIMTFTVEVYYFYFESVVLFQIWIRYAIAAFGISKVCWTASSYMLVASALEQYLSVVTSHHVVGRETSRKRHICTIGFVCLFSIGLHFPFFLSYQVKERPECDDGFAQLALVPTAVGRSLFSHYWNRYVLTICNVFAPFILLAIMNSALIAKLYQIDRAAMKLTQSISTNRTSNLARRRRAFRNASLTTIGLALAYLTCCVLSVGIDIFEYATASRTYHSNISFVLLIDCNNILHVFCASIRLAIYYYANSLIRDQIIIFTQLLGCCKAAVVPRKKTELDHSSNEATAKQSMHLIMNSIRSPFFAQRPLFASFNMQSLLSPKGSTALPKRSLPETSTNALYPPQQYSQSCTANEEEDQVEVWL